MDPGLKRVPEIGDTLYFFPRRDCACEGSLCGRRRGPLAAIVSWPFGPQEIDNKASAARWHFVRLAFLDENAKWDSIDEVAVLGPDDVEPTLEAYAIFPGYPPRPRVKAAQ